MKHRLPAPEIELKLHIDKSGIFALMLKRTVRDVKFIENSVEMRVNSLDTFIIILPFNHKDNIGTLPELNTFPAVCRASS